MDLNVLWDNGRLDHHQHFTGYTSYLLSSPSIVVRKYIKKNSLLFFKIVNEIKFFQKFTGRDPRNANHVRCNFQKYVIFSSLEPHKECKYIVNSDMLWVTS